MLPRCQNRTGTVTRQSGILHRACVSDKQGSRAGGPRCRCDDVERDGRCQVGRLSSRGRLVAGRCHSPQIKATLAPAVENAGASPGHAPVPGEPVLDARLVGVVSCVVDKTANHGGIPSSSQGEWKEQNCAQSKPKPLDFILAPYFQSGTLFFSA